VRKVHKYNIVKDYIKTKIKNGEFHPDEKIPNESEISDILGVSSTTVKKAMAELVNEGLIYRKRGRAAISGIFKTLRNFPQENWWFSFCRSRM